MYDGLASSDDLERFKTLMSMSQDLRADNEACKQAVDWGVLGTLKILLRNGTEAERVLASWVLCDLSANINCEVFLRHDLIKDLIHGVYDHSQLVQKNCLWTLGNAVSDGHRLCKQAFKEGLVLALEDSISPDLSASINTVVSWILRNIVECSKTGQEHSKICSLLTTLVQSRRDSVAVEAVTAWSMMSLHDIKAYGVAKMVSDYLESDDLIIRRYACSIMLQAVEGGHQPSDRHKMMIIDNCCHEKKEIATPSIKIIGTLALWDPDLLSNTLLDNLDKSFDRYPAAVIKCLCSVAASPRGRMVVRNSAVVARIRAVEDVQANELFNLLHRSE